MGDFSDLAEEMPLRRASVRQPMNEDSAHAMSFASEFAG